MSAHDDPNYGCISAFNLFSGSDPHYGACDLIYREQAIRFGHLSPHYVPLAQPPPPMTLTLARAWRERHGASPGWLVGIGVMIVGGVIGTAYGGFTLSPGCGCLDKHLLFRPADWAHVAHFVCATALVVKVFARCVTDD